MKKFTLALAATAALSLGAAALTPAMANYGFCSENPSAKGCPGDFNVKDEPFAQPRHVSLHHALKGEPSNHASAKSAPSKSASHQAKQPTHS